VEQTSAEEGPPSEEPRTRGTEPPPYDPYADIEDWGDRTVNKQGRPDKNDPVGNAVNRILGIDPDEIDRHANRLLARDQHKDGQSE